MIDPYVLTITEGTEVHQWTVQPWWVWAFLTVSWVPFLLSRAIRLYFRWKLNRTFKRHGKHLDAIAEIHGCIREEGETDPEFRRRIVRELIL